MHGEEGQEEDGEVRGEVRGEVEQLRDNRTCAWREDGMTDSRDLEPMWSVMNDQTRNTKKVQVCSILYVGVRHVTLVIVHIGLESVIVVMYFCVAILFVNCCIKRYSLFMEYNH